MDLESEKGISNPLEVNDGKFVSFKGKKKKKIKNQEK